jgi:putative transposase
MHLESRRVSLGGMTPYPDHQWMEQQARNATMEGWGFLRGCRYLLHDRNTKFCASLGELIESGSVETIRLPARSPNLNAFAERWARSVKEECLSRLILFGESSLRRALQQYVVHYKCVSLCLPKIPFSGFHQCNIVTLGSRLAAISIRQGQVLLDPLILGSR